MSKRVLCKFFAQGSCLKGENCAYSHDWKSSPSPNLQICTLYQRGVCTYGSRCKYQHAQASSSRASDASPSVDRSFTAQRRSRTEAIITDTTPPETAKPSPSDGLFRPPIRPASGKRPVHRAVRETDVGCSRFFYPADQSICPVAVAGDQCPTCKKHCLHPFRPEERKEHLESCQKKQRHLETLRHSKEIECNVCFEIILSKSTAAERKFGILSECDHQFCISCIRNWRSSSPASGLDVNSALRACPICRKLSYFVVPSVVWYSSKEEKQEIIDTYKEKLRSIDCKHFKFGNGTCPFGSSCFYRHTVKPGSFMWNATLNPHLYRSRFLDMDEDEDEDEEYEEDGSGSEASDIALQALLWETSAFPDLYGPIFRNDGPSAETSASDMNGVRVLFEHLYSPHVPVQIEVDDDDEELDDLMTDLMMLNMLQGQ